MRRRLLFTCVVLLVASIHSDVGLHGQTLLYQPTVGQELEYGIQFHLFCQDARETPVRTRVRVRYQVSAVTDDHWEASFQTHPFTGTGPYPGPGQIERLKKSYQSENIIRPLPGNFPDPLRALREKSQQLQLSMGKAKLAKMNMYPGLFEFCSGKLSANFQGEVIGTSVSTNVPMLVGQLASFPMIRLSSQDVTQPFGYKEIRTVNLVDKDNEDAEPTPAPISLLHTVKLNQDDRTDAKAFDLETEIAGGLSAGVEIRGTGSGHTEFSTSDFMPLSGEIRNEVKGLTYGGRGAKYVVHANFHRLESWRRSLFDAMLLPKADALDKENLPRLTAVQIKNIKTHFETKPENSRVNVQQALFYTAPPPMSSPAYQTVSEVADRDQKQAVEGVESLGDRMDIKSFIQSARSIRSRWKKLWRLATLVERNWADASGSFSIHARMLGRTETDVALQRVDNGQRVYVPLERLGAKDREIVEAFGLSPAELPEIQ